MAGTMKTTCDVVIVGGGMVGLCLAHQLIERRKAGSVIIIDKEESLGKHSSGRNSGVLHAGLYYKPDSIKAQVCVSGAKRLRAWAEERKLPLNNCGKVIVPQRKELDSQLEVLANRGRQNGASVEFLDEQQLRELAPGVRSSTGRAIWSPNTSVVKPIKVVTRLREELGEKGVRFINGENNWSAKIKEKELVLSNGDVLCYSHLINCTGLQADRVAHAFGVGREYRLLPFKGLYWKLKATCPVKPKCNIYPVPDLNVPFLGVHFTPSADDEPIVTVGPTATPAWGRENYRRLNNAEPAMAAQNIAILARQYMKNNGGFRRYVHEQAFLALPPLLIKAAQELVPAIRPEHIELSEKVGIRAQLFNQATQRLEDDFLCLHGESSTHVLNAISPAFTASFSLADLIIDESLLKRGF